jgi:hypothetical protein
VVDTDSSPASTISIQPDTPPPTLERELDISVTNKTSTDNTHGYNLRNKVENEGQYAEYFTIDSIDRNNPDKKRKNKTTSRLPGIETILGNADEDLSASIDLFTPYKTGTRDNPDDTVSSAFEIACAQVVDEAASGQLRIQSPKALERIREIREELIRDSSGDSGLSLETEQGSRETNRNLPTTQAVRTTTEVLASASTAVITSQTNVTAKGTGDEEWIKTYFPSLARLTRELVLPNAEGSDGATFSTARIDQAFNSRRVRFQEPPTTEIRTIQSESESEQSWGGRTNEDSWGRPQTGSITTTNNRLGYGRHRPELDCNTRFVTKTSDDLLKEQISLCFRQRRLIEVTYDRIIHELHNARDSLKIPEREVHNRGCNTNIAIDSNNYNSPSGPFAPKPIAQGVWENNRFGYWVQDSASGRKLFIKQETVTKLLTEENRRKGAVKRPSPEGVGFDTIDGTTEVPFWQDPSNRLRWDSIENNEYSKKSKYISSESSTSDTSIESDWGLEEKNESGLADTKNNNTANSELDHVFSVEYTPDSNYEIEYFNSISQQGVNVNIETTGEESRILETESKFLATSTPAKNRAILHNPPSPLPDWLRADIDSLHKRYSNINAELSTPSKGIFEEPTPDYFNLTTTPEPEEGAQARPPTPFNANFNIDIDIEFEEDIHAAVPQNGQQNVNQEYTREEDYQAKSPFKTFHLGPFQREANKSLTLSGLYKAGHKFEIDQNSSLPNPDQLIGYLETKDPLFCCEDRMDFCVMQKLGLL